MASIAVLEYFKSFLLLFLSPQCYETFLLDYNYFHVPCLKETLSRGLGYGIIAGSTLVKVPLILKICANKSAEGVSVSGQFLELYGITIYVAYNYIKRFPFSAWGDGAFLLSQTGCVNALALFFNQGSALAALFLLSYSSGLYFLLSGFVSINLLWNLQATSVPVGFIGKMIQAYQNFQAKSMGQQSIITNTLLFLGSLARIFTSVQETGDLIIILTYSLATFCNGILLAQFFIYPGSVKRPPRGKKVKKLQ